MTIQAEQLPLKYISVVDTVTVTKTVTKNTYISLPVPSSQPVA